MYKLIYGCNRILSELPQLLRMNPLRSQAVWILLLYHLISPFILQMSDFTVQIIMGALANDHFDLKLLTVFSVTIVTTKCRKCSKIAKH